MSISPPECFLPDCSLPAYQAFVPWQEFEQVRDVAFQPGVLAMFITPLACVAAFTVVELYPVPWQVPHVARELWNVCWPDAGGMLWQEPHAGAGGT